MSEISIKPNPVLARAERVAHANALIKAISNHGRRFFYCAKPVGGGDPRVAYFHIDARGRLWYFDEYTCRRHYMHKTPFSPGLLAGRGFTHGGTLRGLVLAMADYIKTGMQISPGRIAPDDRTIWRLDLCPDAGWVKVEAGLYYGWGYEAEACDAVREGALIIPICKGWREEISRRETYAWREAA